jgi:hypothetical protein
MQLPAHIERIEVSALGKKTTPTLDALKGPYRGRSISTTLTASIRVVNPSELQVCEFLSARRSDAGHPAV